MEKIIQKVVKILAFFLSLCTLVISNVIIAFAYTENWFWSESSSGNSKHGNATVMTAFTSNILNPTVNSIKFRQDNTYYYFDYNIEYKDTSINRSLYYSVGGGSPAIFATSLKNTFPQFKHYWGFTYSGASTSTDSEESNGYVYFGPYSFSYTLYHKQKYSSGQLVDNVYTTDSYSDPIPVAVAGLLDYYYRTPASLHGYYVSYQNKRISCMNAGGASVSCSSTNCSNSYWHYRYVGTVKIPKSQFNSFRYLSLLAVSALQNRYNESYTDTRTSGDYNCYDIRGNSVDLEPYCNCEHEWYLVNIGDKLKHERRCRNCEWPIEEDHELIYEYDGIENNMCACGYHDKVKYTFMLDDDENTEITYTVSSYDELPEIGVNKKTGYKFKWYEKYEKHVDDDGNLKNIFIATTSTIDRDISNYSTIYKAIYEPITYTFNYSKYNNMGLLLDGEVISQTFTYDEPVKINDGLSYKGRSFVGWSLASGSNAIDIRKGENVINFTAEDNKSFTLYPVYEVTRFTINYETPDGTFSNKLKNLSVRYLYDDDRPLEVPHGYYYEGSFRHYLYGASIIKTLDDIKEYVIDQDMCFRLHAYIFVPSTGRSEGNVKGGMPTAGGGLYDPTASLEEKKIYKEPFVNNDNEMNAKEIDLIDDKQNESKVGSIKDNKNNAKDINDNYEKLLSYLRKKYERMKETGIYDDIELSDMSKSEHGTVKMGRAYSIPLKLQILTFLYRYKEYVYFMFIMPIGFILLIIIGRDKSTRNKKSDRINNVAKKANKEG